MSKKITHEQARERKQNIITKQITLSSDIYSVRLIPISADETNVKEIQDFIDKQQKLLELYKKLLPLSTKIERLVVMRSDYNFSNEEDLNLNEMIKEQKMIQKQIKELENEQR